MERERKLSMTQLRALAWAGAMAPAAEVLPAAALPEGGHGAWLTGLFVLPLLLALGWLLGAAAGDGGLAQGLNSRLGPLAGGAVRILYMVGAAVLAAQRLGRCALRLSMAGGRDGSFWFFLAGLTAVSLWVARGEPAALGRMGQGLLAGLLAAAGAVLVLSLPRLRWTLLFPVRGTEVLAAAKAALPAAGTESFYSCRSDEILYFPLDNKIFFIYNITVIYNAVIQRFHYDCGSVHNAGKHTQGSQSRIFGKRLQVCFPAQYCEICWYDYRRLLWVLQQQRRIVQCIGR